MTVDVRPGAAGGGAEAVPTRAPLLRPLPRYLVRRLLQTVVSLWLLATLVFVMLQLVPGDPARVVAGEHATVEQIAAVVERLGLDRPLAEQYLHYLGRLAQADLGESTVTFRPVLDDLTHALPSTMELVVAAMLVNMLLSIPLGAYAALRHGRPVDGTVRVGALVVGGVAPFWLALMAQYFFGTRLGVLPISGQLSLDHTVPSRTGMMTLDALLTGSLPAFVDAVSHLVLPAVVLALHFAAQLTRAMRTSMLGVLARDHIAVARAKGVAQRRLVLRHAVPNALPSVLSLAGLQVGATISLVVLVEVVFARTGLGTYIAGAVTDKDTYAVLGAILFVGTVIALANLAADLLQLALDPRVRHRALRGDT